MKTGRAQAARKRMMTMDEKLYTHKDLEENARQLKAEWLRIALC